MSAEFDRDLVEAVRTSYPRQHEHRVRKLALRLGCRMWRDRRARTWQLVEEAHIMGDNRLLGFFGHPATLDDIEGHLKWRRQRDGERDMGPINRQCGKCR